MRWNDKRILVTGAGGFIGSHVVRALLHAGADVAAFVHYRSDGGIGNLALLESDELGAVEVCRGDVRDSGSVEGAMRGRCAVFHLASLIGIPYSYLAPRSYVDTVVGGTLNVLEAARRLGTERVVHTSTSEVYGTARYVPMDEDHPLQAQSPYAATKIGADKLAESYHLSFGIPVVTIRPFNAYGPGQSARAIVPTLAGQLLGGKRPVEVGNLHPQRDLTYVEDTAAAFLAVGGSDVSGDTFNVGTGTAVSIGKLSELLKEIVDPGAEILSTDVRRRPPASEVDQLVCDPSKAEETLSWRHRVGLREGLRRTVEWMRDRPETWRPEAYVT